MSRVKVILFSLLAAFALSAVGSASASAACGGASPTNWVFCNDAGTELPTGTVILGLGGADQLLEGKIGTATAKFQCEDVHAKGVLEVLGKGSIKLTYLTCKMTKPAGCKLTAALEKEILTKLLPFHTIGALPGGPPQIVIEGEGVGQEFATLEVEKIVGQECGSEGVFKVTGSQILELPEPESLKLSHEIVATKANSKLKLGAGTASYSGTGLLMLESDLAWAVLPGT